ncbi:MAG: hypothetical protein U0939_08310 [Pirellulales bacterium]
MSRPFIASASAFLSAATFSVALWATLFLHLGLARAAEPRRLTFDGRVKTAPRFVDGGKSLIYSVQTRYNQLSLLKLAVDVADVDGPAPPATREAAIVAAGQLVHPAASTSELAPALSADDRVFAYVRNNGNLHVALVIEDRLHSRTTEVDPGGGFAGIQYVDVSPDGRRVVYAFPDKAGGGQQLISVGVDGQDKRTLTAGDEFDSSPRYSRDGRQLAFASTRPGNFDVFVMTSDGQDVRRLTRFSGIDLHPTWSPDGRRIAYSSLRDGNFDIYVRDAAHDADAVDAVDLVSDVRLTTHPERDDYPVWHPDGRHLATVSERDGRHDLYLWTLPP